MQGTIDSLLNGTPNLFISSQTSFYFFLAGEDKPQTNQPNGQAGI